MHCSSCGAPVVEGLRYCKRCGARVGDDANRLSEASLTVLLSGILGIPIAGIGLVIGLMSVMKKELGFDDEVTIAFTLLSFLLLLAAESVFIWMLVHRTRKVKETSDNARLKELVTNALKEAQVQALPEPISSITESTTRSLEPIHRETKPQ